MSVKQGDDRILLHCHGGCKPEDIVDAMGLKMSDLFIRPNAAKDFKKIEQPPKKQPKPWKPRNDIVASYEYRDDGGHLLAVKDRASNKFMSWRYQDKTGAWFYGTGGVELPLYKHECISNPVYLVEGEKDVDTMLAGGLHAVTNPNGAGEWKDRYTEQLRGYDVCIIPDNDDSGRKHADTAANALHGVAASVKLADLSELWPEIPEKGDVTDYVEWCRSIGRKDEGIFRRIEVMRENTPEFVPLPVKIEGLISAADVPYEPPRWLIAPYFQRGKGTLIQADPGTGKTAFMCAIAAHVSTGKPLLGTPIGTPGNILIMSVEDDLPILRGRLEANNADLTKCYFMTNAAGKTFNDPEIEQVIKQIDAKLIIFDPFQAFLGANVDMFRANETRPALAKLFEMCDRNDCACAIIAHTGKNGFGKSAVNQSLGSVDIPAAMRSVLHITKNPENEEERIAVHVKCSNAPRGKSIAYRVVDRGGVEWIGFTDFSPDDLAVVRAREEKHLPYEQEPLVQVFNQLVSDRPGGGFWSYADVKSEGAKILGYPPFDGIGELKQKLDSPLSRELQQKDGLIVTYGVTGHANARGIRIERFIVSDSCRQEKIQMG